MPSWAKGRLEIGRCRTGRRAASSPVDRGLVRLPARSRRPAGRRGQEGRGRPRSAGAAPSVWISAAWAATEPVERARRRRCLGLSRLGRDRRCRAATVRTMSPWPTGGCVPTCVAPVRGPTSPGSPGPAPRQPACPTAAASNAVRRRPDDRAGRRSQTESMRAGALRRAGTSSRAGRAPARSGCRAAARAAAW